MFTYYLRLAFKSIKRTPILSALMISAIALGIGACMTTISVNYMMSADPIPHKSDQLYYVRVDSWDPYNAFDDPNIPPNQLTWTDATNLTLAGKAFRQSAMARSGGVLEPDNPDIKPFQAGIRLAYNDFFDMFDVPFLYGNPWTDEADINPELVVVLTEQLNERLFGGENSVGRTIKMRSNDLTVIGITKTWEPVPRFYDITTGPFNDVSDMFMPYRLKQELELPNWGNNNCWKPSEGSGFMSRLLSECINNQMWVELPNEQARQDYMDFLDSYVNEQKALGRFPRPLNNKLTDVMDWMKHENVVPDDAEIMLWLSFLFLLVCLLNTIGLLMAKFATKSSEIGLRRAVGASKQALFIQHLVEAGLIGFAGGILGLGLSLLGLEGVESLFGDFISKVAHMDATLVAMAFGLAVLSSVAAGLYPTWKACNIAPASQLKSQ
ncbi:FtsX-like permease family protein [Alteromonadaceae bacterium M269]|nr:FtsX-like permease family protein [Alteromonadaceae bacterium M269]